MFNFFKKANDGKFVSEASFNGNSQKQIQMTPQVLEQLRTMDVTEDKELKLEYFFYTNTQNKAIELSAALEDFHYNFQHGPAAGQKNLFVITGWTTKMKMENSIVVNWTKEMCDLGYKFDCEFDGWGTTPDQHEIP